MKNNSEQQFDRDINFVSDKNPDFYRYYPRQFQSYFDYQHEKKISQLSVAGYLYYQSILFTDMVLDDKDFSQFPKLLICQEEAIKIIASIFSRDNRFWSYWSARRQEYYDAVRSEKHLHMVRKNLFNAYAMVADNKSAFGKIAIDCLFCLTNEKNRFVYEKLVLSHKYFSVGFQLYDDVKDFSEDNSKKQFNWASHLLNTSLSTEEVSLPITIRHKLLFLRGIGQQVLKKSIAYFKKALSVSYSISSNNKTEWESTIIEMINSLNQYLNITDGYIKSLVAREQVKRQAQKGEFIEFHHVKNKTLISALEFIKLNYQSNYAELKHYMYLGKNEGFNNKSNIHFSDTFQRAVLNECLISMIDYNNDVDVRFITSELSYLINRRQADKIGGWSYFPSVKEIAADIDDLGQVMQLFIRSNNADLVDDYCTKAIGIVLRDRLDTNGGIETWIIPKTKPNSKQKKQEHFNKTKWGTGPDVEVVANFLFALFLYDKVKFSKQIRKGCEFILNAQNADGHWESRWYYGKYYGTYVCLRLLMEFNTTNKAKLSIVKALNFLNDSQNTNGGFGLTNDSDALNTSLAILSFKLSGKVKYQKNVAKAVKYLQLTQNVNGSWKSIEFIKPKANEPYKSETLTTAFVIKAISS